MRVPSVKAMKKEGGGRAEQEVPRGSRGEGEGSPGCQPNFPKIASRYDFIESNVRGQ